MQPCTTEYFFDGRLVLRQPAHGYRFSTDPFLLAAHAAPRPETTILDIGTGTAVIPLILCHTTPGLSITAVEIQEELARIARHNVTANGKRDHIRVLHKDVRQMPRPLPGGMDMVIANPPYRKVTRGRLSPDPQKAMARHELTLTLEELIATASRMLKTGGTFITIYPVNRLPELTAALCRSPLCMETLRFIHPRKGEKAKLFMVRTVRDRHPDLSVAPPLYLHTGKNQWSREMAQILQVNSWCSALPELPKNHL